MDSGSGAGGVGLWQEMRQRWQRAAPEPAPQQPWREAEPPSRPHPLAEILARLPRSTAAADCPSCA
jgi:hypothetical protein